MQYQIALCKVCNSLLMVVALLVPSFYYSRLPKELFIWGSTFILWLVPAVAFLFADFRKTRAWVSTQAVSPCSFFSFYQEKYQNNCEVFTTRQHQKGLFWWVKTYPHYWKPITLLLNFSCNLSYWVFFPLFMEYLSKYKRPRFQFKNSLSNFITITCIFTYMICRVAVGRLKWR